MRICTQETHITVSGTLETLQNIFLLLPPLAALVQQISWSGFCRLERDRIKGPSWERSGTSVLGFHWKVLLPGRSTILKEE